MLHVGLAAAMLAILPASALNIDPKADVHPTAVLMGNITVGPYTWIGPKVVIEGDVTIGHHVNILGNAVNENRPIGKSAGWDSFSAWIQILRSEGGAAESCALAGADSGACLRARDCLYPTFRRWMQAR